jgi:hypothetical protein
MATQSISIPAVDLNEQRLRALRFGKIARYQVHNFLLLLIAAGAVFAWFTTNRALHANTQAIRNFRPIVVRENELGQTILVTNQALNFSPDQRSVRSALQWWATLYFSRMRATVEDSYHQSFLWMTEPFGQSVRSNDQHSEWLKKFLKGMDDQYKAEVKNVVLTRIESRGTSPDSGTADIYAVRHYYSPDGIEQDHKDSDDFVIRVQWVTAAEVPNDVQGFNPLGIAVTGFDTFNSLQ